jgi:ketosteroid isomerase-like protein
MDFIEQTGAPSLAPHDLAALTAAVEEQRDREAIRALVALYSIARDDNDVDTLVPFFAVDGIFEIGGQEVVGHPALREFYVANMKKYRTSLHVTHTHVIDHRGDQAEGLVTGHAELAFAGTLMMAAYRYADDYVKQDDRWVFAHRRISFMYAAPVDQLSTTFTDELRMRWPGRDPVPADIPEGYDSYPGPAAK